MQINIYTTKSNKRCINKVLSPIATEIVIKLKSTREPIDTPRIVLDYNASYLIANYAHIPEFNRYYYIASITVLNGGMMEFELVPDGLMSFKTDILNSPAHVVRSSASTYKYIDDNMVTTTSKVKYTYKKLGSGLAPEESTNNYILIVGGKE